MNFDFTKYFKEYEQLVESSEAVFEKIKTEYPQYVKCEIECSDCCHALFDLNLIEALYLNHHFNNKFKGKERDKIIEKANTADRTAYKIKKRAYKESKDGKDVSDILAEMSLERIPCPMLNDKNKCDIYEHRPITCRIYGIPTSIYGRGHTCGKSGFRAGDSYPTVKLEIIQKKLYEISYKLIKDINSKYTQMGDILVPLSTAILTNYNEEYLGINTSENVKQDTDDKLI